MKNVIFTILIFFIYGCGYQSVYKNLSNQDFQIVFNEARGDRNMNNLIKNEINLYSNKESVNKFEIEVDTKYEKVILTKNSAGVVTDYKLSVSSIFTIYANEKSKKIAFNETINIKKQADALEQNLYENSIKRNFASSIREKLISDILTIR